MISHFDEVYALFEKAFIPAELREYEKMKTLFQQRVFDIYGYYQNSKLVGAISVWDLGDFVYLENFAVDASLRGHGIGAKILKELQVLYSQRQLILEVEEPTDDIKKRRISFYQRNDFIFNHYGYIQPALREMQTEVHLLLMSYPSVLNENMYKHIKNQIFKIVYQQS